MCVKLLHLVRVVCTDGGRAGGFGLWSGGKWRSVFFLRRVALFSENREFGSELLNKIQELDMAKVAGGCNGAESEHRKLKRREDWVNVTKCSVYRVRWAARAILSELSKWTYGDGG